ncbi:MULTISPECIES: hypothetical protein [Citrobacter]|uniref:Uncharacterized protein n=1 Tax=Citrobacter amalonaticus TaxID=35703 RepID=A0A8I0MJR5_CITAM|nr:MULTISPECIES: hypothetical protein [Citrobacter]MBE0128167.1 hypothetical protein [Citrobacter amalonaticus]MDB2179597.1 hypothetical protein [Citrobacter farmeri]HCB1596861.1 hypothetical protein [Citrobacter farmeri]
MKLKVIVFVSAIAVTGSALADDIMKAEFNSLQECLSAIKVNGGEPLKIVQDTPDKVTGKLPNNEVFGCEKKETGTKGTYFEGWFTVKN